MDKTLTGTEPLEFEKRAEDLPGRWHFFDLALILEEGATSGISTGVLMDRVRLDDYARWAREDRMDRTGPLIGGAVILGTLALAALVAFGG
jgi:hypothetical protein